MRVWINPTQMATYQVTPNEVMKAIQDKSLEAAPGKFGERSKEVFEYVIKYKGKLTKPEEYEKIASLNKKLYENKHAKFEKKLLGRLNILKFKIKFLCGLTCNNEIIEVYEFRDSNDKFIFVGLLPHNKGRQTRLKILAQETRTMVLTISA